MKKIFYAAACSLALVASSCSKEKKVAPDDDKEEAVSAIDKLKDSLYMYALEDYLWNGQLKPAEQFKPRSFTGNSDADALSNELNALSQVAKNPNTGQAYEYNPRNRGAAKYSFIDDGSVSDELGGNGGDYGFEPRFAINGSLYIKYVYANSPAAVAGIERGDKVTAINGSTSLNPDNDNDLENIVNAFYGSTSMKITVQKADGSTINKTITAGNYTINPVLKYKVLNAGSKKVGYLVFNSFTTLTNAQPKIDAAFNSFVSAGVTDLIVDLRYNGGGYVATSEYLADWIIPQAQNNKLMYTYYYNAGLQADKYPLLNDVFEKYYDYSFKTGDFKPENNQVKFNKQGKSALNINKVVFIVTGSTASASELTINSLMPYMDVKIVGETSYGKPVGFFAIPLGKYEVYMPEFESRNSQNKAEYYQGMQPGSTNFPGVETDDDVTRNFGDPEESSIKSALTYISTGELISSIKGDKRVNAARVLSVDQTRDLGLKLDRNFKGMVFDAKYKK